MASNIAIVRYEEIYEKKWDKFVLEESVNGTFLQTRTFLGYHPEGRFIDCSLMFMKGTNIIAVIPAHIGELPEKTFLSHRGSTFGGIVLGKHAKKITEVEEIISLFENYVLENGFRKVVLKQTSNLYSQRNTEILDYFLYANEYVPSYEIGYYVKFSDYEEEIEKNFSASRRRDYKYSLKNNFLLRELITEEEISLFYDILCNNYRKFDKTPVHSLKELLEFKNSRLPDNVKFYGVYLEEEMIAGSMIFTFADKVFHTQYLACKQDLMHLYPSEFLYMSMIEEAKKGNYEYISFGTSTLEGGKVLQKSLAQFKEGFGSSEYVNRTYTKSFNI